VLGTLHLAEHPDEVIMLSQIAEAEDVPESFLRKIFGQLGRAGIVTAQRGRSGGFRLAKPPEEITLLEVIKAIEGPVVLNVCILGSRQCSHVDKCPLHDVWMEAQDALMAVLDACTFAQLAQRRRALTAGKQNRG